MSYGQSDFKGKFSAAVSAATDAAVKEIFKGVESRPPGRQGLGVSPGQAQEWQRIIGQYAGDVVASAAQGDKAREVMSSLTSLLAPGKSDKSNFAAGDGSEEWAASIANGANEWQLEGKDDEGALNWRLALALLAGAIGVGAAIAYYSSQDEQGKEDLRRWSGRLASDLMSTTRQALAESAN